MNLNSPLLEVKDLRVSIDDTEILKSLNLKINKGEIHAIMGPNGSGKSTFSKVLAGHPAYSILDGDIFQPIWYNWACQYPSKFLQKKETHEFYQTQLLEKKIAFPDLYIIFQVAEKELWIRKEKDATRQRRNFEKHLKIIEPLKTYYQFLDKETDIAMKFIQYTNIEKTKQEVLASIANLSLKNIDGLKTFEQIEHWINSHQP